MREINWSPNNIIASHGELCLFHLFFRMLNNVLDGLSRFENFYVFHASAFEDFNYIKKCSLEFLSWVKEKLLSMPFLQ